MRTTSIPLILFSSVYFSPILTDIRTYYFHAIKDHIKRLPQDESSAVGLHDPGTRQEETSQRSYLSNFGESFRVQPNQLN